MKNKNNTEFKSAMKIGSVCIVTYLASYITRRVLSVCTPQIVANAEFSEASIGTISSSYFMFYAIGQLVNGRIGDRVRAKYLVLIGLLLSGIMTLAFPFVTMPMIGAVCFAVNGFGLSMLRGPLVKTISENTIPAHARNCLVGFSSISFVGPLIAGGLSAVFAWKMVFYIVAAYNVFMALFSYVMFTYLEKKKMIKQPVASEDRSKKHSYFEIFKIKKLLLYCYIGALVEIIGSSVGFWTPTYLSSHLGFTPSESSVIFSVMSVVDILCPFMCLFIYTRFKERDLFTVKLMFLLSAVSFVLMRVIPNVWGNTLMLLVATTASGCASSLLWSIYLPSLKDTGCVSTANGFFDFSGYVAASCANIFFAHAVSSIGWGSLLYVWSALMASGVVVVIVYQVVLKLRQSE